MRASFPSSGFKAKPHIESRITTLKKDWTTIHDILAGVRHGCSGFGYDNGTNTIVASDDVWVDYIKAGKWRGKRFYYYDECCYIFGNDRATGEDAHSAADYLGPANEYVADLSDSESGGPNTVNVADSFGTRPVRSKTPETSSKGRKRLSSDSRATIGDYMLQAAEVMAVEIGKSTIEIAKAILDDKDRREAAVAALEEVYDIPPIERAIYATKLAKENELMVGFLSLDPTYRLAWLQRMFPDVISNSYAYELPGSILAEEEVEEELHMWHEVQYLHAYDWSPLYVLSSKVLVPQKVIFHMQKVLLPMFDVAVLVEGDVKIEIEGNVKIEIKGNVESKSKCEDRRRGSSCSAV
ncbi:hypothetical protein Sjap_005433 [Stephania japonica]|uniref:Myb/SANT-like domain-containing protein n=1 Tax=Stephania japonica TaxID=461633 RepID=A0AAP0K6H5_9MAGN